MCVSFPTQYSFTLSGFHEEQRPDVLDPRGLLPVSNRTLLILAVEQAANLADGLTMGMNGSLIYAKEGVQPVGPVVVDI